MTDIVAKRLVEHLKRARTPVLDALNAAERRGVMIRLSRVREVMWTWLRSFADPRQDRQAEPPRRGDA